MKFSAEAGIYDKVVFNSEIPERCLLPEVVVAQYADMNFVVNGESVSLAAYTINGNNYFKLRDLCRAFDIGVTWNAEIWTVGIVTNVGYTD